jgi:hypothetical protein
MSKAAVISDCERYRYALHRRWQIGGRSVLWVMLNPSTADAEIDDPTIRRCIGFSQAWGFDSLMVGNLYALRSTQPAALWTANDPVGPDNDAHLRAMAKEAEQIVCAWGANAKAARADVVIALLREYGPVSALRMTKGGAPSHPLYLSGNLTPQDMASMSDDLGSQKP